MYVIGVSTKLNKRSSNDSLVIAIEAKAREKFRTASILLCYVW
jgi:hypothetical protein